jgi:hypothetical protein
VTALPPYSLHLSLPEFHLFRVVKSELKGWCFSSVDVDKVKDAMTTALKGIFKNDFQQCFQKPYS